MLCPFAHPVACCWMLLCVVAQSLKPDNLLAPCKQMQHCWPTTPDIVGSCCVRLHVALDHSLAWANKIRHYKQVCYVLKEDFKIHVVSASVLLLSHFYT